MSRTQIHLHCRPNLDITIHYSHVPVTPHAGESSYEEKEIVVTGEEFAEFARIKADKSRLCACGSVLNGRECPTPSKHKGLAKP